MRAILQITENARLICENEVISQCKKGMCVLLGFCENDTEKELDKILDRILKMRIFADADGKLNLSPLAVGADILLVSNFTLYADVSSRRPGFSKAMKFGPAEVLYKKALERMQEMANTLSTSEDKGAHIYPGVFGGDMKIDLKLDGPVTILLDTEDF
ncbi:MAG: D-tyrosyl-tRNA(Tyr) deacylase [Clostridia bacterium]|nr:D-tyrosyl-tRNA(Tyr) deacylase [Clostridia bacterium]